jgi:hypothetical protein
LGLEVALGEELFERGEDRHARDPELRGEAARRGQALAGAQPAIQDRRAIPVVELPVQRRRRAAVDRDDGRQSRRRFLHAAIIAVMRR